MEKLKVKRMAMRTTVLLLTAFSVVTSCSDFKSETQITNWKDDKPAAISITYDDASVNQFRQALPIMNSLGIKGTFFINTVNIPGSQFAPRFIGRPLKEIVEESAKIPTTQENLFERASALRFLNIENATQLHWDAGSLYETGKVEEAIVKIDEGFAAARKLKTSVEQKPRIPNGEVTWDEIRQFAAQGHEFGNHTISHPRLAVLDEANLLYEIEKCKEELLNQLGEEHTFSLECPFGTENERVMQYAYRIHHALRNRMPEPFLEEINRWNDMTPGLSKKEYVQWQRGPLQKTSLELMKSWVDTLVIHDNVWLALTFHGVDGIGWEAKPHQELEEYFRYMKQHEQNLWIAPFGDVTKYMREKMNASLSSIDLDGKIVVSLKHSLDPALYKFPLTLKTYVDPSWKKVNVKQSASVITMVPMTDEKGTFVLYQAVPNSEDIEVAPAE
jgi:peptidoglycan/xylan/chitin deacetylase (PgdA/CDA1 family)